MADHNTYDWKVERTSPLTGVTTTATFRVTLDQVERYLNGDLIQNCFPTLSDAEREFILTGYTEEDWNKMFPAEDE